MKLVLIIGVLVLSKPLLAQESSDTLSGTSEIPEAEELFDQIEKDEDNVELLDRLLWLKLHPYDLNLITQEQLESLPGVTPQDAQRILDLRASVKRFTSTAQLLLIEDTGIELYQKIGPYAAVYEHEGHRLATVTLRSRITKDLQQRSGFAEGYFLGSPLKSYNRLSITSHAFEAGALFEKDAGERTSDGFVSGYALVHDVSFVSEAIAGDYLVEAGQGLVFWRGTAFGKGGDAVAVTRKSALGPQPYRSSDEFNFLRGAAVGSDINAGFGELRISAFFSRRSLAGTTHEANLTSLYADGYFRTNSEVSKKNAVVERLVGSIVRLRTSDNFSAGASAYSATFDRKITPTDPSSFGGRRKTFVGLDANGRVGLLSLFGEVAKEDNGATAGIGGGILSFAPQGSLSLVYRNYSPRFQNLHANGFGERSETNNERGMYIGLQMSLARRLKFSGYFDQFKFPMHTSSSPLPLSGREVLMQMESSFISKLNLVARFSTKTTQTNEPSASPLGYNLTIERLQQKARLTATYAVNQRTRLRGRIDATQVRYSSVKGKETGILLLQEVQTSPFDNLKLECRLIFFDTDSYDSRLYEYENDLRGVFSNPPLHGKGRRWYVLVGRKVADLLLISAKYSETVKEGVDSLGSGLTEIAGDVDSRIAVQIEVNF